jgi:DNA invertase Pin-like site-specific DNA recombinase
MQAGQRLGQTGGENAPEAERRATRGNAVRAAIYCRVSTAEQNPDNQRQELRRYVAARGWTGVEYIDHGVSGAKDRRPALDRMMADAKRRKIDVVICWKLDRFGRSLQHLVNAIQSLADAGVGFQSLGEGIDTQSATGRLMLGILASFAEFERERIRERVVAGLARARRDGQKLGRRRQRIAMADLKRVEGLSVRQAAKALRVPASRLHSERRRVFGNPPETDGPISEESAPMEDGNQGV